MRVEMIDLAELVPELNLAPKDARPSAEDERDLESSIRQFGIVTPLIVTKRRAGGYFIIDGQRRYFAAQALGLPAVPCVIRVGNLAQSDRALLRSHLSAHPA